MLLAISGKTVLSSTEFLLTSVLLTYLNFFITLGAPCDFKLGLTAENSALYISLTLKFSVVLIKTGDLFDGEFFSPISTECSETSKFLEILEFYFRSFSVSYFI
jgi:hypothetical protein